MINPEESKERVKETPTNLSKEKEERAMKLFDEINTKIELVLSNYCTSQLRKWNEK